MAKKKQGPNTPINLGDSNLDASRTFIKGLSKDTDPSFIEEGMWTYARNAVNNTKEGDIGTLSNEESNAQCITIGQDIGRPVNPVIVGAISLFESKWVLYTAIYDAQGDNVITSEIGLFEEDFCKYRPIVRDKCLNFSKFNLVTGGSREKGDCTWQVYWADNLNPDRYLNIGDPKLWPADDYSWLGGLDGSSTVNYYSNGVNTQFLWPGVEWQKGPNSQTPEPCLDFPNLNKLNCDEIRLASLVRTPCVDVSVSDQPGQLDNGSYTFAVAYTINNQKASSYFSLTYVQPIWNEVNGKGAVEVTIENLDSDHFDQYVLACAYVVNGSAVYKQIGFYSISTEKVILDQINDSLVNISPSQLFIPDYVIEKSEQIVEANRYLLRIGPSLRFDFNYQPLANMINTEWVSVEYPETYYRDGGKNAGYLRDEVYTFFIRWIYDTGDKSSSYHIPGRAPSTYVVDGVSYPEDGSYSDINTFPGEDKLFETINTATVTPQLPPMDNGDGGKVVAYGKMGYWESTEIYPDNKPEIWNSSYYCWTKNNDPNNDLCGKPIRHHKFPDNSLHQKANHFNEDSGLYTIRLMGVRFKNIILPKDNDGNDIPGIVGYEILRGSRQGNRSVVAKGMVNNFRDYTLQGTSGGNDAKVGLYANYPYNSIRPALNSGNMGDFNFGFNDPYILSRSGEQPLFAGDADPGHINQTVPRDMLSFLSPDTSFQTPYLGMPEFKVYGYLTGEAEQSFVEPNGHPEFKLFSDSIVVVALLGGLVNALFQAVGTIHVNYPAGYFEPEYVATGKTAYNYTGSGGPVVLAATDPIPGANLSEEQANQQEDTQLGTGTQFNPTEPDDIEKNISKWNAFNQIFFPGASSLYGNNDFNKRLVDISKNTRDKGRFLVNPNYERKFTAPDMLPSYLQFMYTTAGAAAGVNQLLFDFLDGAQTTTDLLTSIIRSRQYALELIGHGNYSDFVSLPSNQTVISSRFNIEDAIYVWDDVQQFPEYMDSFGNSRTYIINNKQRPRMPVMRVTTANGTQDGPYYIMDPSTGNFYDQSLMTLDYASETFSDVNHKPEGKLKGFNTKIASWYGALKYNIRNQYGQLNTIRQILATPCEQIIDFNNIGENNYGNSVPNCTTPLVHKVITETSTFFGGDTYINRFTDKNIMPFFENWLYNQGKDSIFNYFLVPSVPFPKFWANSEPWDFSEFNINNVADVILGNNQGSGLFPSSYYNLDNKNYKAESNKTPAIPGYPGVLFPKNSYFYLAACGIRDFFVESDVLVDFRTRGNLPREWHYDKYRYTNLKDLFDINPEVLIKGNFYGYDYSLSVYNFFISQILSLGNLQDISYDPTVAQLCFTHFPNVVHYSLPETQENLVESWRTFLLLNKVTFKNNINSIKSFGKTGMFVTFEDASPLIYQGVDERETYLGVSATVGDGLLFSATPVNVTAADKKYEYGSSQDRLAVLSSPAGLYYMSQQQGKIFSYSQGLKEISNINMKWWFNEFLPYKLIEDFPNFEHVDNPVAGIGCSIGYNNNDTMLYFSKKDYMLKPEYKGKVTYVSGDTFHYTIMTDSGKESITKIKLGDERVFEDASWTLSYDPKNGKWISFHDWHPNLYLSGRNKHYTTKLGKVWEHNAGCNDYCNFYGKQFPFEVGIPFTTGQIVTTFRSVQYLLECYKRDAEFCVDQYHVLDYNFDQAVVYNSEQVSGYLNLNMFPKNNITLAQEYPKINTSSIDILVSKVEQKYRFNEFWDITKDRGEFPQGAGSPATGPLVPNTTTLLGNYTQEQIWKTQANGYIQTLNPANLNYNKPQMQRKKFRHYTNFLKLSKLNPQDTNMVFKITKSLEQNSPR